jgi:hypothetical protein
MKIPTVPRSSACCGSLRMRAASNVGARDCIAREYCPSRRCRRKWTDADGELIAVPTEWDEAEHGPAPKIRIRVARRARPAELAGVGDRALLRVEETDDEKDAVRYSGRIIKLIGRAKQRVLGIFRPAQWAAAAWNRSTRSSSARSC